LKHTEVFPYPGVTPHVYHKKSSAPTDNQIYRLPANQFSPSPGTTLNFGRRTKMRSSKAFFTSRCCLLTSSQSFRRLRHPVAQIHLHSPTLPHGHAGGGVTVWDCGDFFATESLMKTLNTQRGEEQQGEKCPPFALIVVNSPIPSRKQYFSHLWSRGE